MRERVRGLCRAPRAAAPTSLATYRRDLRMYVLPAFRDHRLSRLDAEEIDSGAAPSSPAASLAVVGAPPLPHPAQGPAGGRGEGPATHEPVRQDAAAAGPTRPMAIFTWAPSVALAEAHPTHLKPMIYLALDSGMRWSELVGLRRGQVDLVRHKVRVDRAAAPCRRRVAAPSDQDVRRRPLDHHLVEHRGDARAPPRRPPRRRQG